MNAGYCYLLHFATPISERHTCQHYIGFAHDLPARLAEHAAGRGARLTQVARERGISWELARTWEGDRRLERRLKDRKEAPRLCPICHPRPVQLALELPEPDPFDVPAPWPLEGPPDAYEWAHIAATRRARPLVTATETYFDDLGIWF